MRRKKYILLGIRILLAVVFIVYGLVKLWGIQLAKLHLTGDINGIDSITLVWYFFGYSPFYAKFIGVTELVAGILIAVPRTARLGTLLVLGLGVNITFMDYCFNFPSVKYLVTLYTLLAFVLLLNDFKFYKQVFFDKTDV